MQDIVPSLLELIETEFDTKITESEVLKKALKALEKKKATYHDVNEFAIEVGQILSQVFANNLSVSILPDGKMYFNIAERILNSTMGKNHELISGFATDVQQELNRKANIRIISQTAPINQSRIDGIIERLANEDDFEKIKWILGEPIINFSQSIVDDSIKINTEFQTKLGLQPKITRIVVGDCCDWCRAIAGTYDIFNLPANIFRRHRYCRCTVEYNPGDGKKINVHSHRKVGSEEDKEFRIQLAKKQQEQTKKEREARRKARTGTT